MSRSVHLTLPWPPTTNQLHTVSGNRKILSSRGRQYRADALAAIVEQRPERFGGERLQVTLMLNPPTRAKRDVANFEKAAVDALVFARVFDDDEQIDDLRLVRGEVSKPGRVRVIIISLEEAADAD